MVVNNMQLKNNDILIFKNKNKMIYSEHKKWLIEQYYDDELNCLTNDDYTIIRIYRPHYELIQCEHKIKRRTK